MDRNPQRIVCAQIPDNAIPAGLFIQFRLESAEQPVPDNENPGIIPVEIDRIGRMMDPVMRRCVHDRLDRCRQAFDHFGVDPELIDQIEAATEGNHGRRESQKNQP